MLHLHFKYFNQATKVLTIYLLLINVLHILMNKLIMRNQPTTKAIPKIYVTQINGSLESHSLAITHNH